MPKSMEIKLRIAGKKKGLTGERLNAYIYGTMQEKTSWKPTQKNSERSKEYGKRNS